MIRKVTVTFLKIMRSSVLLLVAFALAFYILYTDSFDMNDVELFTGLFHSLRAWGSVVVKALRY
jgi:hypothetical protein